MLDISLILAATVLIYLAIDSALGYAISMKVTQLEGDPHELVESSIILSKFVESIRQDPSLTALEVSLYNSFAVLMIVGMPLLLELFRIVNMASVAFTSIVQFFLMLQLVIRRGVLGLVSRASNLGRRVFLPEAAIELVLGLLLVYLLLVQL